MPPSTTTIFIYFLSQTNHSDHHTIVTVHRHLSRRLHQPASCLLRRANHSGCHHCAFLSISSTPITSHHSRPRVLILNVVAPRGENQIGNIIWMRF
ncbi:hypothetical protein HanIR_Chr11g0553571 [Helianthus annuus]|nr:hypothetical protein HanIR_Chr11g0553571 [Helianthus annuus]